MAILLLEKDPFVEDMSSDSDALVVDNTNTRRPLYGIARKETRYAYISVRSASEGGETVNPVSIVDSSAPKGMSNANHNFILQSVQIQRQEKAQIIETFGQEYAFFFGQRAQIISFQGALINTSDFNWKNEWLRNYDTYLRGTKCVETKSRVYVGFDDILVVGYVLGTSVAMTHDNPNMCPFSFQLLLTTYQDLSEGNEEYVLKGEQGRSDPAGDFPEYVAGTDDPELGEIGDDGVWTKITGLPGSQPETLTQQQSAWWLTGAKTPLKQYREPSDALREIDLQSCMQQNGIDRTTALRAQIATNSSEFPLSARSSNSESISNSLSGGISGTACIIDDQPVIS
jgi:hypothetical protein